METANAQQHSATGTTGETQAGGEAQSTPPSGEGGLRASLEAQWGEARERLHETALSMGEVVLRSADQQLANLKKWAEGRLQALEEQKRGPTSLGPHS